MFKSICQTLSQHVPTTFRLLTTALPYLNQQSWVWSQVEKVRRKLEAIGMPPVETNKYGRASDFLALTNAGDGKSQETFEQHLDSILAQARADGATTSPTHGVTAGSVFSEPVRDMIAQMTALSPNVVFVSMPLTKDLRHTLYDSPQWQRYQAQLQQELKQKGIAFIDAHDWVPDTAADGDRNFIDAMHLNDSGAEIFSQRIGTVLHERLH